VEFERAIGPRAARCKRPGQKSVCVWVGARGSDGAVSFLGWCGPCCCACGAAAKAEQKSSAGFQGAYLAEVL
jgi:hypothetical protein